MKYAFILVILVWPLSNIFASNIYYNADGSFNTVNFQEGKLTIRLDTSASITPFDFGENYDFLEYDTASLRISNNFYIFSIDQRYAISEIIDSLLQDSSALMINPVIRGTSGSDIYLSNEMICYFDNIISHQVIDSFFLSNGVTLMDEIGIDSIYYHIKFDSDTDLDILDICNLLYGSNLCRFVQPNFIYTNAFSGIPQDPYFGHQWHLNNTGQTGGTADADIDMLEAWDIKPDSVDGSYTILGILDSGFELDHEDLPYNHFVGNYDAVGAWPQNPVPDADPSNQCLSGFDASIRNTR